MGQEVSVIREEEWMRRFQGGDEGAYLLLFNRFHRPVYRYLAGLLGRSALAEDLTQDVFLTLYEKRDTYRRRESIGAWLFTVARNRGLRARQRAALEELPEGQREVRPSRSSSR